MEIEMSASPGTVLVYGAAGAQGSAIVRAALEAGAHVRILLRPGRSNPYRDRVDIVRGDLSDRPSLDRACLGVDKIVLTLPLIYDRGLLTRFGRNAIDAAKAASVSLLVLNTSGPLGSSRGGSAFLDAMIDTRAHLKASGVPAITVAPTL
jgi:NAD(P)H dehydrogenase (quinone)